MTCPPTTELDKALAAFFTDSGREENRARFYELFLNSSFFMPIIPQEKKDAGENHQEEKQQVTPLILEAEGNDYLVLFDTLERLQIWADADAPYVPVVGYVLAQNTTPPLHWALNVGSDYSKTFVPEEISWLAEMVEENLNQAEEPA